MPPRPALVGSVRGCRTQSRLQAAGTRATAGLQPTAHRAPVSGRSGRVRIWTGWIYAPPKAVRSLGQCARRDGAVRRGYMVWPWIGSGAGEGVDCSSLRVAHWVADRRRRALFCVARRCSLSAFSLVTPHRCWSAKVPGLMSRGCSRQVAAWFHCFTAGQEACVLGAGFMGSWPGSQMGGSSWPVRVRQSLPPVRVRDPCMLPRPSSHDSKPRHGVPGR
jgi:hypothetical protein